MGFPKADSALQIRISHHHINDFRFHVARFARQKP